MWPRGLLTYWSRRWTAGRLSVTEPNRRRLIKLSLVSLVLSEFDLNSAVAASKAAQPAARAKPEPRPDPPTLHNPPAGPVAFTITGSGPYCIGHAFRKGEFANVVCDKGQVTVKNRWPDGSVKFAIVAGNGSGVATLSEGVQPSGAVALPSFTAR